MSPKQPSPSRIDDAEKPRKDTERDTREAVVKDADKTNERSRDAVHGDGDSINLPDGPSR